MNSQNQLNLMIQSEFNPVGFQQATRALANFAKQVANVNTQVQAMGKQASNVTTLLNNTRTGVTSLRKQLLSIDTKGFNAIATGTRYFNDELRKINVSAFNNIATGVQRVRTEMDKMRQTNVAGLGGIVQQAEKAAPAFLAMGGAGNRATNAIKSGISGVRGYMGGLIQHTISVGDIFGFYIGMVALQKIYDLSFGMSMLKDSAKTTFEFIGMEAKEVTRMMDGLMKINAKMPTINFADMLDAMKRIRLSAKMSGDQMVEYGGVVGDTITLFAENGRNAQDASLAIADAMSGAPGSFKRMYEISGLLNKTNLMAHGWAGTNDDIKGFFTALNAIYSEMGVSGISQKINSFSDALGALEKQLSLAGTKMSDFLLPGLKTFVMLLGQLISITPAPILFIGFAFVTMAAATMVLLPLLGAIVTSFQTMDLALLPLSSRIKATFEGLRGYVKATARDIQEMNIAIEDSAHPAQSYSDFDTKKVKNKRGETELYVPSKKETGGWNYLANSIEGANTKLRKFDKSTRLSQLSIGGMGGSLKGLTSGLGATIRALATLSRSMLVFMLTNPVGWILLIVTAIITAITVTDRWGEVWALFGDAWNIVSSAVMSALNKFVDYIIIALKWLKESVTKALEFAGIKYVNDDLILFGKKWSDIKNDIQASVIGSGQVKPKPGEPQQSSIVTPKLEGDATSGIVGRWTEAFVRWNNLIVGIQRAWNDWMATVDGSNTIDNLELAFVELSGAVDYFWTELYNAWTYIQPTWVELVKQCQYLYVTLFGVSDAVKEVGNQGQDSGNKTSIFKLAIDLLIIGVKFLTGVIRLATPIIKLFIWVLGGITIIAAGIIHAINFIIIALKGYYAFAQSITPNYGWLQTLYDWLVKVWHWITGNSPGVIPALQQLYAVLAGLMPQIVSIISQGMQWALQQIWNFIINTARWFAELPGRIYNAIARVPQIIGDIINRAFQAARDAVAQFWSLGEEIKNKIVDSIKAAFNISSPSKVTAGLGSDIGAGLMNGISNWVSSNVGGIVDFLKKELFGGLQGLIQLFSNWDYRYYWNSMQSIGTSIATLSGNCWDAAVAFIAMANAMGISASMYETSVNGIDHEIVSLGNGMWVDPSGILGTGLHTGGLPGGFSKGIGAAALGGGAMAGGAPITVNVIDPVVKEELDIDRIAKMTGIKIVKAVRYGV